MASQGSLTVNAYLSGETVPVFGAVVTVTKREGDKDTLLGVRITDINGKTPELLIDTPDVDLSLSPQEGAVPFTSVDVRVDHPSVYTVITRNVQIFPGKLSIENVELIPLSDRFDSKDKEEEIDITPQDL
jgi:hypothetical protein